MKTALILHGKPSKKGYYDPKRESQSNEHWIPWLQHQLLLRDILAQTPEWPKPYDPNYKDWSDLFSQFKVDKNTILIGHSCGAG
ncbi:MAG: alpha/beta hydrolase, partial [Patescibacteria group bacterium]